jgi:hypothetical protein
MKTTIFVVVLALIVNISFAENVGASEEKICIAAIATIMGRSPSIISSKKKNGVYYLNYTRKDGTNWSYRCKTEGSRVVWASETGRWRVDPLDEKILYQISPDGLTVMIVEIYSDGSESVKTFSDSDFK